MTFPQLQYLLEIHRTGSVTQAAKKLFVTQSSVSIALSTLEKELGFPIFIRSKKGLTPTPKGATVIEHAARICESHQLITNLPEENTTQLRISSNATSPAQAAFVRLVKENRHRRDIYFSFSSGSDNWEKLRNFNLELDLSMTLSSHHLAYIERIEKFGLTDRLLATIPGCIRIGEGHRLYEAERVTLDDLRNDVLLDTPTASVSRALLNAGILRIQPNHRISSMHHDSRRQLLREGLAYEIRHYLPNRPEPGFRYIPLEALSYKFHAVTNPLHPPIPELDRYLELLEEELRLAGVS